MLGYEIARRVSEMIDRCLCCTTHVFRRLCYLRSPVYIVPREALLVWGSTGVEWVAPSPGRRQAPPQSRSDCRHGVARKLQDAFIPEIEPKQVLSAF